MSNTHTIRLTPLGKYFFGSEMLNELGNRSNYFMRSNRFPQQTAILGLLRHQLLLQKNLIPLEAGTKATDAGAVIGLKSFEQDNTDFGVIENISPVYVEHDKKAYYLNKYHRIKKDCNEFPFQVDFSDTVAAIKGNPKKIPVIKFDDNGAEKRWIAKYPFTSAYIHSAAEVKKEGDVFEETYEQVGIWKDRSGKPKDDSYFKQVFARLKDGWSFCFTVTFSDKDKNNNYFEFNTEERIVAFGKEQSLFRLSVDNAIQIPADTPAAGARQKLVLLSDAYISVEQSLFDKTDFILAEGGSFRHTKSTTSNSKHYSLSKNGADRSAKYKLLQRGSVLYTSYAGDLQNLLQSQKDFEKIGYNHSIIIN